MRVLSARSDFNGGRKMSDAQKVEIVVKAKSKKGTGLMDGKEAWYNASKGVSFDAINKGDKLQLTYVDGPEGGKFVTAFTKVNVAALPPIVTPPPTVTSASSGPSIVISDSKGDTMSKAEWDAKDLLKSKGGFAHDAATITAAMCAMKSEDEVKALFANLYNHILKVVRG
jgi:hypothetical protein